ncbi:recombinase family protein [Desulfoscipio gibsoniae]|uniref:Site-specific recombinase, DNA invertase Pin n=1 Tax=Desulfoscipio gibsoniae DSM 7213 TaxID=767817 RepID=R4KMQ6_9FIRM|nr:recombinase family protein [Desulfoscipio gibsoniae]AGL02847.1 site-specific recombinase, DNA invertase Pin [Desulfoscipio gibsoniae DSM 7213]
MQKEALAELLKKDLVIGYVYTLDGERQEYYFAKSPSNIASFIMLKKEYADKIVLTDTLDRLILNTFGEFINRCPDQKLLREITKELVPMQMGDKKPDGIAIVSMEEAQAFWNQQEQKKAWVYCRIDAPEDTHGALKGQKKDLMDYAEQMGFEVVGYSEDLGSGMEFDRTGLAEVAKAAGEGRMDILLIKKLDCLGRNTAKTLEFIRGLEQLDIELYSPLEGEIQLEQSPYLSMQ